MTGIKTRDKFQTRSYPAVIGSRGARHAGFHTGQFCTTDKSLTKSPATLLSLSFEQMPPTLVLYSTST